MGVLFNKWIIPAADRPVTRSKSRFASTKEVDKMDFPRDSGISLGTSS